MRLETATISKPKSNIPKEFLLSPAKHPDKFLRVVDGDVLKVQAREEAPHETFRTFFAAARFSMCWLPDGETMCRLKAGPHIPTMSPESGLHLSFGGQTENFSELSESSVLLGNVQESKRCTFVALPSTVAPNAYRFEAAYWPGRYLSYRGSSEVHMAKDDNENEVVDFLVIDYAAAYRYITMGEVLAEAIEKFPESASGKYVKLSDLRADLNVRLFFQQILGTAVWSIKDFEKFFEGKSEEWDLDSKHSRVRLRPKEEPSSQPLTASGYSQLFGGTEEVVNALQGVSSEELSKLPPEGLLQALQRLKEPNANIDPKHFRKARGTLLGAIPLLAKRCFEDVQHLGEELLPFPSIAAAYRALVLMREQLAEDSQNLVEESIRELSNLISKRLESNAKAMEWSRLPELLEMPINWKVVAKPLRSALAIHLRRRFAPPGSHLPSLRALKGAPAEAKLVAEELANRELQSLGQADIALAGEVLLAIAESGSNLEQVCERLIPPMLFRLPMPSLVDIVAALGEQACDEKLALALQTRVAVAGPILAQVPPEKLVRLLRAGEVSPTIWTHALGPIATAAAGFLAQWPPLLSCDLLLITAANQHQPNVSSGSTRLFQAADEALSSRLQELPPKQLLQLAVAAGSSPQRCGGLLASVGERACMHLQTYTSEEVAMLTTSCSVLGHEHPAKSKLIQYWEVYFTPSKQADTDGKPRYDLTADDLALLLLVITRCFPESSELKNTVMGSLREEVSTKLTSTGRDAVLMAFAGCDPANGENKELLQRLIEAQSNSPESKLAGEAAREYLNGDKEPNNNNSNKKQDPLGGSSDKGRKADLKSSTGMSEGSRRQPSSKEEKDPSAAQGKVGDSSRTRKIDGVFLREESKSRSEAAVKKTRDSRREASTRTEKERDRRKDGEAAREHERGRERRSRSRDRTKGGQQRRDRSRSRDQSRDKHEDAQARGSHKHEADDKDAESRSKDKAKDHLVAKQKLREAEKEKESEKRKEQEKYRDKARKSGKNKDLKDLKRRVSRSSSGRRSPAGHHHRREDSAGRSRGRGRSDRRSASLGSSHHHRSERERDRKKDKDKDYKDNKNNKDHKDHKDKDKDRDNKDKDHKDNKDSKDHKNQDKVKSTDKDKDKGKREGAANSKERHSEVDERKPPKSLSLKKRSSSHDAAHDGSRRDLAPPPDRSSERGGSKRRYGGMRSDGFVSPSKSRSRSQRVSARRERQESTWSKRPIMTPVE